MSAAARGRVESRFTWPAVARRTKAVLEAVAAT
jgi:glycosyltransferase involved in cell wall biosynthesis